MMDGTRNKSEILQGKSAQPMAKQRIPWILLLLILAMVGAMLAWNSQVRYQEFTSYQQRLMESSVNGTAAQIEVFIKEMKRSVHLFADAEHKRLEMLAADPDDQDTLEQLNTATRRHFPEAFAFTVAHSDGTPLLTDYDGLIGEVCLKDMHTFSANRQHSQVYVHPHPTTYHFDIMVDWEGNGQPAGIFFVSFKTDILSRILEHGQLPDHQLLLLKQDIPGLIEITADGTRIELQREFKLKAEEMQRIGYSVPVKGTAWDIVDIPNINLYTSMRSSIWREMGLVVMIFVTVTAMMVWLYQQAQAKRYEFEYRYKHDPYTGLPNQYLFRERFDHMVEINQKTRVPFTLLLIDMGRFRRLKGTFFEHRADDTLIKNVAERLENVLEDAKIIAQIGERDFAVLLPAQSTTQIESLKGEVLSALKQPFGVQDDIILPNPCAGYARFPEDGEDVYALIRHAGKHIYTARQSDSENPDNSSASENASPHKSI